MSEPLILKSFDLLATAPGGVARLRELIFELAVQGKLVAQVPFAEPATTLLEKMRGERDDLVFTKKIKPGRQVVPLTKDSYPFSLPNGWAWTRLGDVSSRVQYGYTASADFSADSPRLLRITDIQNGKVNWSSVPGVVAEMEELAGYLLEEGDLLIARTGGTIGKSFLMEAVPVPAVFASYLIRVSPLAGVLPGYLRLFASSPHYWVQLYDKSMGTGQPNVNGTALSELTFPLPPLVEQSRIVTRVEELMKLCDALELNGRLADEQHARLTSTLFDALAASESAHALAENWERVAANFDLLLDRPEAVDVLQTTVVQLAVKGLLVPQKPLDGSAEGLLAEQIDAAAKVGTKRARTELQPLVDDESPFVAPPYWVWSRFGQIVDVSGGVTLGRKGIIQNPISLPYLRVANVQRGHLNLDTEVKTVTIGTDELSRFLLKEGDLLITEGGDWDKVGRTCTWRGQIAQCVHQNHVFKARAVTSDWLPAWGELYLNSTFARDYFASSSKQTTNLASINMTELRNCMFPLPPLPEQRRILERVEEVIASCDELRSRLRTDAERQVVLANALVAESECA